MLKVENISKNYDSVKAVDNFSFEVNEGEIFGLLGSNGAGKTTTFRIIMGLLEPNSGKVTLNNKTINYDVTDKIGFLTEERSLLTKLTVEEQVLFYGKLKSMTDDDILKELDYWLDKFEIKDYKNRKIKELSKGNQQKIQFITSIINNPKLLILDEPFSGLDPINIELFKEVIKEFKQRKAIIIFSSHRMDHVELFCEKLVIMVAGKPVISGYLKDIKKDYRKKNIIIRGNVDLSELKKIKGVLNVIANIEEIEVKIDNINVVDDVFKYIAKCSDITKFVVEEPSLNEIFIEKVGESYEK
jgi:ABC-2 type transport system ATP-binding protein